MISTINEIKLKIIYSYYEIGGLYYSESEKNRDKAKNCLIEAKKNLYEAKKLSKKINNYFALYRINIDLFLVLKKLTDINKENGYAFDLLDEVIHQKPHQIPYNQKMKLSFIYEAYKLKIESNKDLSPDILILNSNPLKNDFSVLNGGIYAYHNNQYYLLEKLETKIKRDLFIESKVLNENNLKEAFDKNGKILIIQSDYFSEKGEIFLELENGESQKLSNEDLEKYLPVKINFDILILCFFNSGKLINFFEGKVKYLITFDYFDYYELNKKTLLKYNHLSIEFLINFIEKVTEKSEKNVNNIEELFEKEKNNEKLKDYDNITKYIRLTNKDHLKTSLKYDIKDGKIIFKNTLLNLPLNLPLYSGYENDIYKLIKIILSEKHQFINVVLNNDFRIFDTGSKRVNKKSIIGIELMKFFHRHQIFNKQYYIYNTKKYGYSLNQIFDKVLEDEKSEKIKNFNENKKYSSIILVNYFKNNFYKEEPLKLLKNVQYLIMKKNEINCIINKEKPNSKESELDKKNKDKIMIYNPDFEIYKVDLKAHFIRSKKQKNSDNNLEEDNKIMKDLDTIFNYSFESDKTLSDKSDFHSDSS